MTLPSGSCTRRSTGTLFIDLFVRYVIIVLLIVIMCTISCCVNASTVRTARYCGSAYYC